MKKLASLGFAVVVALGGYGVSYQTAHASSGSERECTEAGGTYEKDGPNAICVYPEENVGNAPPHSNSQTTQTTETGQGNINNKETETCTGPRGQCK